MAPVSISAWKNEGIVDLPLEELRDQFNSPTWIDITDPKVDDLERLADALAVPRHMLIGRLKSNHSHIDSYPEYTKVFAWHLIHDGSSKDYLFDRNPVVIFTNGISAITISDSRIGTRKRVIAEIGEKSMAHLPMPARIAYIVMRHLIENYERQAERFEDAAERLEEQIPPWPRPFYAESFAIKREASRLLRLMKHIRIMTESIAKGSVQITLGEEERRLFDTLYDRALGAEETMEVTLDTIRDLISMHMDMVSHDMDKGMRLIAALTAIVAVPSVIASLLGMNLIEIPWPLHLWQVILLDFTSSGLLAVFFYRKGWL